MPKVEGTRKQKAKELLDRLTRGPSYSDIGRAFNVEEASSQYKMWAESWIIPEVLALVPELKVKRGRVDHESPER